MLARLGIGDFFHRRFKVIFVTNRKLQSSNLTDRLRAPDKVSLLRSITKPEFRSGERAKNCARVPNRLGFAACRLFVFRRAGLLVMSLRITASVTTL
jgi:hypothetical protein